MGFLGDVASKVAKRVSIIYTDLPGAGTGLFTAIAATNTVSLFRINICIATGGTLTLVRTVGGASATTTLNGGTALTSGVEYIFDVLAEKDETITLKYSATSAKISRLIITEQAGGM